MLFRARVEIPRESLQIGIKRGVRGCLVDADQRTGRTTGIVPKNLAKEVRHAAGAGLD
ncbi:MAG: hypothetical protein ABI603_11505 [Acidobacteriota bacterium]